MNSDLIRQKLEQSIGKYAVIEKDGNIQLVYIRGRSDVKGCYTITWYDDNDFLTGEIYIRELDAVYKVESERESYDGKLKQKLISITDDQDKYIRKYIPNFSLWVRERLDSEIDEAIENTDMRDLL